MPDQIYHLAGQAYLNTGEANPYNDLDVNAKGMINLLRLTENTDISLIYTSTGAVYGLSEVPHKEDSACRPMCNYGISKLAAELYLQKWVSTRGVDAKIVRFSSIYGPGRRAGPVNVFLRQAINGKPITVHGSGSQTRDYVHVEDVVRGMELVQERGQRGHIYNLGFGEEHSVAEVAGIVQQIYPSTSIEYVKAEYSPYDLPRSWFDITKARGLGYNPRMHLELGIRSTAFDMENSQR